MLNHIQRQRERASILIFSLLNLRKKTAAAIAGIGVGALCLWGVAQWQNISAEELLSVLLGTLLMLGAIMVAALTIIVIIKLAARLIGMFKN